MNFERLVDEHKDAIYRQMLRVCGNREDAEDVLIEALWKAYVSIDQLRDPASFRAWLAQIARRVCFQLKQHEALLPLIRLSQLEDAGNELPDTAATPDKQATATQMRHILADAIDRLPPDLRAVYDLRDLDEMRGEEVADRLGISVAAMKSRLHRARRLLRDRMEAAIAGTAPTASSHSKPEETPCR